MDMNLHTPGPWLLDESPSYAVPGASVLIPYNRGTDAEFYVELDCDDGGTGGEAPQAAANARLISASPDLLAACALAERFLRQWDADNTPPTDSSVSEVLRIVAAAVCKARKESS